MKESFEVATGSILGRNHRLTGKNNQDAYFTSITEKAIIAVVCDGCGSGKYSEVGAQIGAPLTVKVIQENLSLLTASERLKGWQTVKEDIQKKLYNIATNISGVSSLNEIICSHFLFTILGVLITPLETTIFSIGDGYFAINGEDKILDFPNNAPPYIAYGLFEKFTDIEFTLHSVLPTDEVNSILIATDGVEDMVKAKDKTLPGKSEKVGTISQFWQENRYFHNPDAIRRRLWLMNRESTQADWEKQQIIQNIGLLSDDTTLIAIRRSS